MMYRVLRGVSHWVYLSPKNLAHLVDLPIGKEYVTAIPNGMPIDDRPFEYTRADLGIDDDDLVFVIASRAIVEKGWEIGIRAMLRAQDVTTRRLHLVLCGSGPEFDRLKGIYSTSNNIHLMGFQERIPGAYRLGDVALLPTRFAGESFPLGLIQAMQAKRPVIATDIGEIRNMLKSETAEAGITLPFLQDDDAFVAATAEAMIVMCDQDRWSYFAEGATTLGKDYAIENVADHYSALYESTSSRGIARLSFIDGRIESAPSLGVM
jgi:glycosyltransferase involved in cell wall biosynthesis